MAAEPALNQWAYVPFEEYLEGETRAEVKHEYFDGQVFAMAGASQEHELVAMNLASALHGHLKGGPCRVFKSDMKLRLRLMEQDLVYYPDIMVACDPEDDHRYYRERPKLLVEVLSEDQNKDRVEKFLAYQRIASLEEYVMIGQDSREPEVLIARRSSGWEQVERLTSGKFTLESVGLTLSVADVYAT